MEITDITGMADGLKTLGDISMSGVVVIFSLIFLIMFISMFLSQNKNIRTLNKANQKSLESTIALYEETNNSLDKRLLSLEKDKNEILIEFRKEQRSSIALKKMLNETREQLDRAIKASEDCILGRKKNQEKMEHLTKTIAHLEKSLAGAIGKVKEMSKNA